MLIDLVSSKSDCRREMMAAFIQSYSVLYVSNVLDSFVVVICFFLAVIPVAGGSGVNTATHLSALVKDLSIINENNETMDVTLQTAINQNDHYGRMLVNHAKDHAFELMNCSKNKNDDIEKGNASTGHCIVIVGEGDRSFVTHLGVIGDFKASDTILHELVNCRSADPTFQNHHHHIHIAGYYNMPGFSKGNLKRRLKLVREKRRCQSHGLNTYTTTTSLVPQYDATEEWDGGLLDDVLPLVDFLILNSLEAGKISKINITEKDCGGALNRAVLFAQLADFFWEKSPLTHVILTLGKMGAVAFYQGEVIASMHSPKRYANPVDPTGAGDAFAAGFLFGVMNWRKEQGHENCAEIGSYLEGSWTKAIIDGMRYGCATGSACVARVGASVPASKDELEGLLNNPVDENERVCEEEESNSIIGIDDDDNSDNDDDNEDDDNDHSNIDSEYESEYDSEYDEMSVYSSSTASGESFLEDKEDDDEK